MNRIMTLLVAAMLATGVAWTAAAQPKAPASAMAIVDTKIILDKAEAAKGARQQIERMRGELTQSVKVRQDEINRLSQDLARERATLPQEAFQQRLRDVLQLRAEYQRMLQEQQQKLEAASRTAAQKIEVVVSEIVDDIKKERQYGLVMLRSATMGTPTLPDITQDVLGRLDRRLPHVEVVLN